ncbi:hypothetical protein AGMMS49992_07770 [Clostridia bacterium]|nr:hypothetical protein AGMMS49992_07770 [Clostridia bacterium]
MDARCTLYVSSCDAYADLWEPFFLLFKKYWPDCPYPIVLVSETKTFSMEGLDILCPRFYKKEGNKFVDLNNKRPPQASVPWGELNIRSIKTIDTPYLFFILEDFLLSQPVDQSFVDKSLVWMEQDSSIGRFGMRPLPQGFKGAPTRYSPYVQVSFAVAQAGLWRKDLFLRSITNPGDGIWKWEARGFWWPSAWKKKVYTTPTEYIRYPRSGALFQGKWQKSAIKLLKANGIEVDFKKRGVSSHVFR